MQETLNTVLPAASGQDDFLSEDAENYRTLFDNMMNGVAFCRMLYENGEPVDFIHLKVNKAFHELTGFLDVEGKKGSDTIPGIRDVDRNLLDAFSRVANSGNPDRFEIHIESLQIWCLTTVYSTRKDHFVCVFDVITERKKAEETLRESEARYSRVMEGADQGYWEWNLITGKVAVNARFESMLGFEPGERDLVPGNWATYVYPDDLKKAMESFGRHLQGETSVYEAEMRCRSKSGEWVWIYTRGKIVARDADGNPTIISGTNTNITARKKAEEELRLASLVYQNSSEAMTVTDAEGVIIAVNPAFCALTGYEPDEVVGKNPKILKSGHHGRDFYDEMWRSLKSTGRWQGEIWNRRKNGEIYPEWLSISSIFEEDGSVHRRVALFSDITKKKELETLLWQQANIDLLTGLPNRRMFLDRLDQEVRKASRHGESVALMFLDLDGFKDVNDTLGHDMGDLLLRQTAERLQACIRDTDVVARLGGDEFTLILGELQETGGIERVASEIISRLSAPFVLGSEQAYVTASIGITLHPQDADKPEDLITNADQAMYAAKRLGKNRHHYYAPSMQQAAQARMRVINDLRDALGRNELLLYYQPIVDMATGKAGKAEALIRWLHPERGMIPPADFISLAEETGMIVEIGDWIFREAASQARRLREKYDPDFQISVNKSPVQFRSNSISYKTWFDYLHELGLDGDSIVIEITESLLMDTGPLVTSKLDAFRKAGMRMALDDFGTGYSSLSYLKRLDLDFLKIDQSFVRNLREGSDDLILCEAVIMMAHKLGIKVIAEGVETEQQRDLLLAAGCDFGQGYLFSRPVPSGDFEKWLEANQKNTS